MTAVPGVHLDFAAAADAVAGVARRTPLLEVPSLSERLGRPVLVKAECLQVTGSFKVRGAAARLSALSEGERGRGVVACSSGNHGRAVAYVAARLGVPATVCVPEWVDPLKLEAIRSAGAEAVLAGDTFDESERYALELARREGRTYVSAYDDPWVIAGQGTIALEILDELGEPPAAVLVPLSGGGLVAGIAAALRERLGGGLAHEGAAADGLGAGPANEDDAPDPLPRVVAVSAERAAVMLASVRAGRPVAVPEEETLASALAGGLGPDNRYSFPLVRDLVDEHVTVTEEQIARAMRYSVRSLRLVVEGGGAVGLAALLEGVWPMAVGATPEVPGTGRLEEPPAGSIVVVLSGGNVAAEALAKVLRSA